MHPIANQIIVPLDGSARAARALLVASALRDRLGLPVTCVGVVGDRLAASLRDAMHVEATAAGLPEAEIVVVTSDGGVVDELLAVVRTRPGALVCLSSTGHSHTGATIGSVAEGLIKGLNAPVLMVGPGLEHWDLAARHRAVAAVDDSHESEIVLGPLADWCAALDLAPEVVQVLDPKVVAQWTGAAPTGADLGNESARVSRLAAGVQANLGRPVDYEVLHGDRVEEALRAHTADAAMVVMSTRAAEGWHRLVKGSVAMAVLHHANCPVLLQLRH